MSTEQENMDMLARQAMERLSQQNQAFEDKESDEYYNEFFEGSESEQSELNNSPRYNYEKEDIKEHEYEIDSTGEELWRNGPTKSMIQIWKKQFEGHDVLYVDLEGHHFIIRTLNRHEYKSIVSIPNSNALSREEIICETVVLFPQQFSWKEMAVRKAGIPSSLAEIIMKKSGFTSEYIVEVL